MSEVHALPISGLGRFLKDSQVWTLLRYFYLFQLQKNTSCRRVTPEPLAYVLRLADILVSPGSTPNAHRASHRHIAAFLNVRALRITGNRAGHTRTSAEGCCQP